MNFEEINESLEVTQKFIRIKPSHRSRCIPLSTGNRGKGIYPWTDPTYKVGDDFFVPKSYEEVKQNKGRPSPSPSAKKLGFYWKTIGIYHGVYKQNGYRCIRINAPEKMRSSLFAS